MPAELTDTYPPISSANDMGVQASEKGEQVLIIKKNKM